MKGSALVLTYHAVEQGPPPLCLDPALFRAHVDCIAETGAAVLTVSEIAAALRSGMLPERAVAITFDDGAASAVREAAPLLAERGLRATVFCVAGRLGAANDWPSGRRGGPRLELAAAAELAELAGAGFEIGSHGFEHAPLLADAAEEILQRELAGSRLALEDAVGVCVRSFAYPYGLRSRRAGAALPGAGYTAGCTTALGPVRSGADPLALPRVDAHYLRRPALLRRALTGSLPGYLGVRRVGARARRVLRPDYGPATAR